MTKADAPKSTLSHSDLLELKRWNTPSIFNGWEQITNHNPATDVFNLEPCQDFMPQMGPMVGYAVTVVIEPSNPAHVAKKAGKAYRQYVASAPGPCIVVVQDLDKPNLVGSFWGEVNSNVHKVLGCVGTITDGTIRDVDEMVNAGFKAIASRFSAGHAHVTPIRWGCEVEVFGRKVQPGQLIHADKHGFMAIPAEDARPELLEATQFMDHNECATIIPAARSAVGKPQEQIIADIEAAYAAFGKAARKRFGRSGE